MGIRKAISMTQTLRAYLSQGFVLNESGEVWKDANQNPIETDNTVDKEHRAEQLLRAEKILQNLVNAYPDDRTLKTALGSIKADIQAGNYTAAAVASAYVLVSNCQKSAEVTADAAELEGKISAISHQVASINPLDFGNAASSEFIEKLAHKELLSISASKENELTNLFSHMEITNPEVQAAIRSQSLNLGAANQRDILDQASNKLEIMINSAQTDLSANEIKLLKDRLVDIDNLDYTSASGNIGSQVQIVFKDTFTQYAKAHPEIAGYIENTYSRFEHIGGSIDFLTQNVMSHKEAETLLPKKKELLEQASLGPLNESDAKDLAKIVQYEIKSQLGENAKAANAEHVHRMQEAVLREIIAIEQELKKPKEQRDIQGVLDKTQNMRESILPQSELTKEQKEIAAVTAKSAQDNLAQPNNAPTAAVFAQVKGLLNGVVLSPETNKPTTATNSINNISGLLAGLTVTEAVSVAAPLINPDMLKPAPQLGISAARHVV
jgi:hypothetical protein